MAELKGSGIVPGHEVQVQPISRFGDPVAVSSNGEAATVAPGIAHAVLVRAR